MEAAVAKGLFNSHTYPEYRKLVTDLLREEKVTGNEQSKDLLYYTDLNETRMNRLDKTIVVVDEVKTALQNLKQRYVWLVISEGWCGDAAQVLPVLNKMAEVSNGKIQLKVVLRDDNDYLMQHFLTNGRRAVPKLIFIEWNSGKAKGVWGDRPKGAVDLVGNYKAENNGVFDEEGKKQLQLWYLHDKGVTIQKEVIDILQEIEK